MLSNTRKLFGNLFWRQHKINVAGGYRALRHAVVFRRFVLSKSNPVAALDSLQSDSAIGSSAGQNHADRLMSLIGGERFEKMIDRAILAVSLLARHQFQSALLDGHGLVWRDYIDMVWPHTGVINNFKDRQVRDSTE